MLGLFYLISLAPPEQQHMITSTKGFVDLCIPLLIFSYFLHPAKTVCCTSLHPRPFPCPPLAQPTLL